MRFISLLSITLLLFTNILLAQEESSESAEPVKYNTVKANIFGAFVGQYQLAYERALNNKISVQLSAGLVQRDWKLTFTSGSASSDVTQEDRGFILIPEVRYYTGTAPDGFYLSVFARYRTETSTVEYETFDSNNNLFNATSERTRDAIGGGLLLGYQVLADPVVLDFQVGPQYKSVDVSDPTTNDPSGTNPISFRGGGGDGIGVRIAFNFGIAF